MRFVLIVVVAVQMATSALLGYAIMQNSQAHDAMCSFRAGIELRRDDALQFKKEHPLGVISPKTGAVIFTPDEIQRSIDTQNASLASINESGLDC